MLKPLAALVVIAIVLILFTQLWPGDPAEVPSLEPAATVTTTAEAEPPRRRRASKPLPSATASDPTVCVAIDEPGPEQNATADHRSSVAASNDDVVVQVVGSDGAPRPGIKIVFFGRPIYAKFRGTSKPVPTDEAGLARISVPVPQGHEYVPWVRARAEIHGSSRIEVAIKLPQEEPARLVVPVTGTLEIKLVGPDNERWPWPTELLCGHFATRLSVVEGGRMLLEHVQLGQRFQIIGGVDGPYGFDAVTIAGPTTVGDTVRRQIRVVCRGPHLTGRVFDPEGRPVTDGTLGFQRTFLHSGVMMRGPILFTRVAEGGRFLLPLERDRTYRALRVQWRESRRVRACTELPLLGQYSKALHHVGDIRLGPVALLARGRVVTASGGPLRHKLWVELHPNDTQREPDWGARKLEGRQETFPLGSREFDEPAGLYVETVNDEDGRFEIHGAPLSRPFTLRVRGGWYSDAERTNVSPGTEDIQITVSRWGRIQGRICVSPEVEANELLVRASTLTGRLLRSNTVMNDGKFFLSRLSAGLVTVSVLEPGADRPIATIQNVRVTAGTHSDDERLRNIDLRGTVKLMVLRVVDSSGRPVRGAQAFKQGLWYGPRYSDANGAIRFLASEAPMPLAVRAPGYRPCEVKLQASQTVRLKPGIPVRLLLDFGMPIPPGLTGRIYFNHEHAHSPGSGSDKPAPVRKDISLSARYVDLIAESPGKHEVTIFFEPDEVSAHVEGQVVEIQDQAEPQQFRIRFDPEKVRKALERVRMTLKTK